ncbi:hypothetical protein SUGI_0074650 [Cryptomeria japonica]|nr:hypothetical protein SUGI_0074650 [Cryptomeria japonica]
MMASRALVYVIMLFSCLRNTDHNNQIACMKSQMVVNHQNQILRCNLFEVPILTINDSEVCAPCISSEFLTYPNLVRYGVECKASMLRNKFDLLEERSQAHRMLLRISVFLFKLFLCIRMTPLDLKIEHAIFTSRGGNVR